MFSVLARLCCCSCWSGRPGGRRCWCWCIDKVPLHLSVQVLEAIHREKILVQKKRQGRGFRGVFGKVQTYTTYVFSIYDLQVQRLGMETFRTMANKETEAEQQV